MDQQSIYQKIMRGLSTQHLVKISHGLILLAFLFWFAVVLMALKAQATLFILFLDFFTLGGNFSDIVPFLILGFLFPVVSLILGIVVSESNPRKGRLIISLNIILLALFLITFLRHS
jgi:hypothetical protein